MIKEITKDILSVESGVIVHQVNCQGGFGGGIAGQIAGKYPIVRDRYLENYNNWGWKLGQNQWVYINEHLYFVNMAGQDSFGRGNKHTNYAALATCLFNLRLAHVHSNGPIYLPHGLGCGLGGGKWEIVREIINDASQLSELDFIICKLE